MAISFACFRGTAVVRSALMLTSSLLFAACGGQSFGGVSTDGGSPTDSAGPDGCQGTSCPTDSGGTCTCTGTPPQSPNYECTDGATGGPFCGPVTSGGCAWQIRNCTPGCPFLGCEPACPNGVLKDSNGCDTCACAPVPDGGSGSSCTSNAECGAGFACAYKTADACSAVGTCVTVSPVVCNAFEAGCACDGSLVNLTCNGFPSGYASAPVAHTGECAADAGVGKATDGGACCPSGWGLYSCTYSDGGSGMACHNPALGCASSTTCGQGCDEVVTGRCVP
jgi:hypothetical protein